MRKGIKPRVQVPDGHVLLNNYFCGGCVTHLSDDEKWKCQMIRIDYTNEIYCSHCESFPGVRKEKKEIEVGVKRVKIQEGWRMDLFKLTYQDVIDGKNLREIVDARYTPEGLKKNSAKWVVDRLVEAGLVVVRDEKLVPYHKENFESEFEKSFV